MFELVVPNVELNFISPIHIIEDSGRICWKSEHKKTDSSKYDFIKNIIKMGHESVIEHSLMTVTINTDRGVSHELVRHRLASYSQESTRYVNYHKRGIQYIIPIEFKNLIKYRRMINNLLKTENMQDIYKIESLSANEILFLHALHQTSLLYNSLIDNHIKPQLARQVLPNALRTTIVISANFREWRHIFKLRYVNKRAHPHIRYVCHLIRKALIRNTLDENIDLIFGDIFEQLDEEDYNLFEEVFKLTQENAMEKHYVVS